MRFGKSFQRRVGGSGPIPLLGSDTAPTGLPTSNLPAGDNQLAWKIYSINGFPIQRLAVGYGCSAAGLALPTKLYVYDDLTKLWFISPTAPSMALNSITFFDVPALCESAQGVTAGSLEVALVVSLAGADPNGTYTFAMGADLSNY